MTGDTYDWWLGLPEPHAWVSSGECRCGARFATRRGLMVHLAKEAQ